MACPSGVSCMSSISSTVFGPSLLLIGPHTFLPPTIERTKSAPTDLKFNTLRDDTKTNRVPLLVFGYLSIRFSAISESVFPLYESV
jgi:hypothetical protein